MTETVPSENCSPTLQMPDGVFALSGADSYLHASASGVSSVSGCLGYAIYNGGIGSVSEPAGTGSSAVKALVLFVDGKPVLVPKVYLFKDVRVVSAASDQVIAEFDVRERGIDPAQWTRVTYTLGADRSLTSNLLDQGSRMYIRDFRAGSSGSSNTGGTSRPASDFRARYGYEFKSPTGAIRCRAFTDGLLCQAPDYPRAVAAKLQCGNYPGNEQQVSQFGWSNYDRDPCGTIIQGQFFEPSTALGYGETVTFTPRPDLSITCSSAEDGIRCENPKGYGFLVSKTEFTTYRVR